MARILIVDDDPSMTTVLSELLKESGHETVAANTPARAMELVRSQPPDLVLTDIEIPPKLNAGLELLGEIKDFDRTLPVIVITGLGTKERAIAAIRAGAQDFIEKQPFELSLWIKRIENALLVRRGVNALKENAALKSQLQDKFRCDNLVGTCAAMQTVYRMISRVADTDCTVLILGESGTGKELVAQALHYNSRRAALPFIAINCAAMPEQLLESELFGHCKGAFTGAAFDKKGLLQAADGGTIFLDEIGSMPLALQSKLLRFLQDKELRRVGDTQMIKVDVRVIAATNEPLEKRMKEKNFREDLFYRLSVIPIPLPPLRDRLEDIPLLAHYFIKQIAQRNQTPPATLAEQVSRALLVYAWPGNVRELQNAMERACVLCDNARIELKDLPERLQSLLPADDAAAHAAAATLATDAFPTLSLKGYLQRKELEYIQSALRAAGSDKQKAADLLGVSPATLYRKLAQLDSDEKPADEAPPAE